MNIIVGISEPREIEPLAREGATEFYGGLFPSDEFTFYNHRPPNREFNFSTIRELRKAIDICRDQGKKLFLAVNDRAYHPTLYNKITSAMLKVIDMGIDGFIIADFFLLFELQKKLHAGKIYTRLHLSSLADCFEKMTIDFYKQFEISRVILPQQINAREAAQVIRNSGVETEVFYHQANDCRFINGNCYFCSFDLHTLKRKIKGPPCRYKFTILNKGQINNASLIRSRWGVSCGINNYSNLYDYVKIGVSGVKIGIRHKSQSGLKIKLLKRLAYEISLIHSSPNKAHFLREVANAA